MLVSSRYYTLIQYKILHIDAKSQHRQILDYGMPNGGFGFANYTLSYTQVHVLLECFIGSISSLLAGFNY